MHEFVASVKDLKKSHKIKAYDVGKALLDKGFHSPTIYFPLIVEEALMFEPTETQSKETLDDLAENLKLIVDDYKRMTPYLKIILKTYLLVGLTNLFRLNI